MAFINDENGIKPVIKRKVNHAEHERLVSAGCKWLQRPFGHRGKCATVLCELVTIAGEVPDVIGWYCNHSILIEAKASKADFKKDKEKPWRIVPETGMGNQRYFIADKGVIDIDNLPEKWGLLEVEGNKITVKKEAEYFAGNKNKEIIMLLSHIRRLTARHDAER